jgi:hypothetical protein
MKIEFKRQKFHPATLRLIKIADEIIADYQSQGYRLTLRQLYYQFVSRNIIPNSERSYKNLGNTLSLARLAGLIDWEAIEDRVRVPRKSSEWESVQDLVASALYSYRLPRWDGQDNYVELWVEKDALAGVLSPLAGEFHVTLMVNRGYSSQTAMFESAQRFTDADRAGKKCHLLYLGDHDPSGEDMVRDIGERLEMFGCNVEIEKLALTMAQVKEYNPPPNPAKMSDSRAQGYVDKHGAESWEVDALPPDVLSKIIRAALDKRVNMELMNAIKAREEKDKDSLRVAAARIGKPEDTGLLTTETLKAQPGEDVAVALLRWKMARYQSE